MDHAAEARDAQQLVQQCLAGDQHAIQTFQQRFGEIIYGYPMRVYGTGAEDAAGFYLYAFDRARIFRRLRTFKGHAPFRAYLLAYVLDHLMLDWKRTQREIETVPLQMLNEFPTGDLPIDERKAATITQPLSQALAAMSPAKAAVMKLLYVEDCELGPADIQYLAQTSGRAVKDVLVAVDRLRATVREREANLKRIEDTLDAVQAWIQLYERRLQRIDQEMQELQRIDSGCPEIPRRLAEEHTQLLRKIARRQEQRRGLLARAQRRKITAPYKDIAALLNTTTGNVASQIARGRRELAERLGRETPAVADPQTARRAQA